MTEVVTPEQRSKLAEMIMEASTTSWFEAIRHDDDERALILVDEIVKMGWRPPQEKFIEEWRTIPGYDFWEASNGYMVRHKLTKEWVKGECIGDSPVYITIHDNQGMDVVVSLVEIHDLAFPKEPAEPVEPEWRDITAIVGLTSFEISNTGLIRHKKTKRLQEPTYSEDYRMHGVRLVLNGNVLWIDGLKMAAAMWEN